MQIELRGKAFNPWQEIELFQQSHPELNGKFGATSIFIGTMRDFNNGNDVSAMTLEHYPAMTQKHLEEISQEAKQKWGLLEILVIHRFGDIKPNDPIVLLAVWSAHRGDALQASRYLIEELKMRAPFWKKEKLDRKERWVEKNTASD
jgi:molybdopterin synthase catalytic subunit